MMQDLSDVKINLLILDETIDALDVDGKEKLIDILLNEEHLNTFLVSHGYSHPLLEKIHVVKTNKISRLE
jgi:ABC-type molybdenum transport system ATPase subunit/photorepair protein PhrA